MAARIRSLTNMVADLRFIANIENELVRHPDANLQRLINESWQELRELVSDGGFPFFLKAKSGAVTAGAMVPDAASDPNLKAAFGTIPLPTEALRVYAIDLEVDGQLMELDPLPFSARNDYQDGTSRTGTPAGFFIYDMGQENSTGTNAGAIAIMPAPESAFKYTLWYLPVWTDITTGANAFNSFSSFEQWVLWNCAVKIASRDNDRQGSYAIAVAERERERKRIETAARAQRTGPLRVQDTRARREKRNLRRWGDW